MKTETVKKFSECSNPIGLKLKIYSLSGEKDPEKYMGKIGFIMSINGYGQLHGTWNSLAVIPEIDKFIVIDEVNNIIYESQHFND